MSFGVIQITNKGRALQAKALTGVQLNFTRIAVGDGQLSGQVIAELNGLINEVESIALNTLKVLPGGKAKVGGVLSNQNLHNGFYWRELGVFADDPDLGEILYCYGNAGALAEYIPGPNGSEILERQINVITIVGDAPNISAIIDQSLVFATREDINEAISNHEQKVNPHGITAEKIGAETPDGAQAKVNALAGEGNTKTVKDLDEEIVAHKADYMQHTPYAIATGNDSYAVSISGISSLVEGMSVKVKFTSANTGACTLNINGLGAIPIKKSNGNDLSAGNIKAGQICHLVYTGSVFQLLGEGGEYGTAQPNHVLEGITFGTEDGLKVGTMLNRGGVNQTLTTQGGTYTIPEGYHDGTGTVKAQFTNLIASNIRSGVNVGGVVGTFTGGAGGTPTYEKFTVAGTGSKTITMSSTESALFIVGATYNSDWAGTSRYGSFVTNITRPGVTASGTSTSITITHKNAGQYNYIALKV